MTTTAFIVPFISLRTLYINKYLKFQTSIFNPICHSKISTEKNGPSFPANGGGRRSYLIGGRRSRNHSNTKMDFGVYSSVQPEALPLSEPPPNPWKNWILGLLLSLILSFLGFKWGPLAEFKEVVDGAMNAAEFVAESVEKVANKVDKYAEDAADELPEKGMFKKMAINFLESAAEKTAKTANLIDEAIDKVQEMEEKVEAFFETDKDDEKIVCQEERFEVKTSNAQPERNMRVSSANKATWEGYEVGSIFVPVLVAVKAKHPDTFVGFRPSIPAIQTAQLESFAITLLLLCNISMDSLSQEALEVYLHSLRDFKDAGMKVEWLESHLSSLKKHKKYLEIVAEKKRVTSEIDALEKKNKQLDAEIDALESQLAPSGNVNIVMDVRSPLEV